MKSAAQGAIIGGVAASITGYIQAKQEGLNPWTGLPKQQNNLQLLENHPDYKPFTKNNFRHNLKKYTGESGEGMDAHHMLPKNQEFQPFFREKGINVHDPINGAWWESASHRRNWYQYNDAWLKYIDRNQNATPQQMRDFGKSLTDSMKK